MFLSVIMVSSRRGRVETVGVTVNPSGFASFAYVGLSASLCSELYIKPLLSVADTKLLCLSSPGLASFLSLPACYS